MPKRLTMIIGAGASHDCVDTNVADVNPDYRPPLVNNLFDKRAAFNNILSAFPGAEMLSDDIRTRILGNQTLESILRDLAASKSTGIERAYRQVPPYLRTLFFKISNDFVRSGGTTKYSTMLKKLDESDYDEVLILTLNYDTLIEAPLEVLLGKKFKSMDDYLSNESKFRLIKLHGSINWGTPLKDYIMALSEKEVDVLNGQKSIQPTGEYRVLKTPADFFEGTEYFYPALAVPIEGKTGFVCPEKHREYAIEFLSKCEHFIFAGFSANDAHVIELFSNVKKAEKIKVIGNKSAESSRRIFQRIATQSNAFGAPRPISQFTYIYSEHGFSQFISLEMDKFLK